jgi:predicted nucleic acid-binding protein
MTKVIISDTSCLIALSRIGKLEILHHIFSKIVTTKQVQQEFGQSLPSWVELREFKNESRFQEIKKLLDTGEASAIALALETERAVLCY